MTTPFLMLGRLAGFLTLASIAGHAVAQQQLLNAQSEITFTSKQMGVPVEGRFQKFDAQVLFDPAKPENSSIVFRVDPASATLGVPQVDAELPKPSWFNVVKFPQSTFSSQAFRRTGPGKYEVTGTLTIKGRSQTVTLPAHVSQTGATTLVAGGFTIKRLVFRVGDNEWADTSLVADDVAVRFKLAISGVGKL